MSENLYDKKIKGAEVFLEKYKSLLTLVEGSDLRANLVLALNNQMEYNQANDDTKVSILIKQLSIPTIAQVLSRLPVDIMSLQVLTNAEDDIYYFDEAGKIESLKQKKVKGKIAPSVMLKGEGGPVEHRQIIHHCYDLAINLSEEIIIGATQTMIEKAKEQIKFDICNGRDVIKGIQEASDCVKDAIGRAANFVVLPVGAARMIKEDISGEYDFDALPINVRRIGILKNRWVVYINGHQSYHASVGYRGLHPVDAPLVCSPHTMFYDPIKRAAKTGTITTVSQLYALTVVKPDYLASIEFIPKQTDEAIVSPL